jgi:hypothetical protein
MPSSREYILSMRTVARSLLRGSVAMKKRCWIMGPSVHLLVAVVFFTIMICILYEVCSKERQLLYAVGGYEPLLVEANYTWQDLIELD